MNRPICICTGWCQRSSGHSNPNRSRLIEDADWICFYWRYQVIKYFNPNKFFIYVSNSDRDPFYIDDFETQRASHYIGDLPYHHDWAASQIAGAMFCYLNDFDFVYIEQDCFVHGLDKAIAWAQQNVANIAYNCDKFSYATGWAAHAFMYIKWEFLPTFMNRMVQSGMKDTGGVPLKHEQLFHRLFAQDYTNWPFGYDRKRPIDWTLPMFYAQQLSDEEIERFQAL